MLKQRRILMRMHSLSRRLTVPDAERCRKASREGTSRVFEARAGDKPGLNLKHEATLAVLVKLWILECPG